MSEFAKFLTSPEPGDEVVVSGISGKFPKCDDINIFKEKLFTKEDMVEDIIKRWEVDRELMPRRGGTLNNIDVFDPGFFGIPVRQAHTMDPMLRMFLETALEAIFDAGLHPSELEGTRTGVYVGACWADAEYVSLTNVQEPHRMGMTGFMRSFICHRLAYFLKLKGPCFIADTACSSSLNLIETAFKDIRTGKCDSALVGGTNLTLLPGNTLQFYNLGVLSLDGRCKVFDEEADGYVRSEAVVCVLLQKAKDSRRIYAQIVYAKVNSDGYKEGGITFPSVEMQSVLMDEVYAESGVHPSDLYYLEAHCTGTRVGDPQEIEAIDNVLGKGRQDVLLVGSVKSNIGHTEPASGLCSLAKVIIAMETDLIPPNINLKTVKKGLKGFEAGRLKPVTENTAVIGDQIFMGINNFGFGGNNCHVVLKRFNKKHDLSKLKDKLPRLICVSGRSQEAVLKILNDIREKEFNIEYIKLLHEIFKFDIHTHNYRGIAVISKNGCFKTSICRVPSKLKAFVIHFGNFNECFKDVGRSFMNIPSFSNSIKSFNNYLKDKNLDVFNIILNKYVDSYLDALGSVAVQIGIGDMLKSLKLKAEIITGESWGILVCSYFYGYLTTQQIIDIVFKITGNMKAESTLHEISVNLGIQAKYEPTENIINLNISNSYMASIQTLFDENYDEQIMIPFLDVLGRLYENGYNPQLQNLYPDIHFPVSRGTPMISHLISWDHSKVWTTCSQIIETAQRNLHSFQTEIVYSPLKFEQQYIRGHVVGRRNLLPATEYLFMIWRTMAHIVDMLPHEVGIVFEDVHFLSAMTFPKTEFASISLGVQKRGYFEISHGDIVVVRGKAKIIDSSVKMSKLPAKNFDQGDSSLIMDKEDIYKELNLRGYNYKGMFQSLVKVNLDATSGLVKWENNWVTFMDNILQIKILQHDTRNLYVPTGLKKCIINPSKHTRETDVEIPITVYKEANLIKCESIEMYGLEARAIAKKREVNSPILEKYVFVSNVSILPLEESLRIVTQLLLENSQESNIKSLELPDDASNEETVLLLPKISEILEDVPLIKTDFTISTKLKREEINCDLDSINVELVHLTPQHNYLLIICTKILERLASSKTVLGCLSKNNFLLTREDKDFIPCEIEGFQILTVHTTENEKLILVRKSEKIINYVVIEVSSDNFHWLSRLQMEIKLKSAEKIVIFSQNAPMNGIIGLANCILRENGGKTVQCFFILGEAPVFDVCHEFYKKQLEKGFSINIYKKGQWGTYRHLLLNEMEERENEHCLVNTSVKGDLSSLKWYHGNLSSSSRYTSKENFIKVHYAALNFKDIMIASGRISADTFIRERLRQENLLGMEYSGVNLNGEPVMGIIEKQGLSTVLESDPLFRWDVPKGWSLEEAATVPVVYCTVIYGLLHRARLRPGMSILIHSGTGGIGLAAINVCSYYKCEIFVTVGAQEKREYLRKHFPHIPDDHIGNSRDTSFEQMIEKQTNGRGVDLVLNSLAEEKLLSSVRCLARGGGFVEIGKFDLAQDNPLNMLLMEKEAIFHGVMLDILLKDTTETKRKIRNGIMNGIEFGYIKPLPITIFSSLEVRNAFKYMATGKHMGKVLIRIKETENCPNVNVIKGCPKVFCNSDKSYIIIGGLGGFGLELVDWLATKGATKLILSSRQGVRNGYQMKRISLWKSYGIIVRISTANITTRDGCLELMKEAEQLGPVDGIFNLGVVLQDAAFENQTEEAFNVSFGPKAYATKFLDEISRTRCPDLRYFVVFSSISCGRGNAGQTNYGMANSVMERICENRRNDNLPGVAIEWGAIGDVGLVAQLAKNNIELEIRGTLQQRITSCLDVLDHLLTQTEAAIVSSIVVAPKKRSYGSGTAVDAVLNILGIKDVNTVSRHATLAELGIDSITATEVIQVLESEFDIYLSTKDIRTMTLEQLIKAEKLGENNTENKMKEFSDRIASFMLDNERTGDPFLKMITKTEEDETQVAFFLSGFEGSISTMEPIAKHLNCICLGLKYSFTDPDLCIEEMAKCFLPSIEEKLNVHKRFNLICHSFGGLLAMELASLLERKGYSGTITAIDTSLEYVLTYIEKNDHTAIGTDFEVVVFYTALELFMPLDFIKPQREKLKEIKIFKERVKFAYSLLPENIRKPLVYSNIESCVTMVYNRLKTTHSYKFAHEKLKSHVHLFKASNPTVSLEKEDYGWSEYCQEPVDVNVVQGNHVSMLNNVDMHKKISDIFKITGDI